MLLDNKRWIALFSHSGKELQTLTRIVDRVPDEVLFNGALSKVCDAAYHDRPCITDIFTVITKKWTAEQYRSFFGDPNDVIITMHGWMSIIPGVICDEYQIFNGHPALINIYPNLKGKDKQEDVIGKVSKFPHIGSVVHRAVAEVDAGNVYEYCWADNPGDRDAVYETLKITSLSAWLKFFYELK